MGRKELEVHLLLLGFERGLKYVPPSIGEPLGSIPSYAFIPIEDKKAYGYIQVDFPIGWGVRVSSLTGSKTFTTTNAAWRYITKLLETD